MTESIVLNTKDYFFFMYSFNQIQDVTKFCCPESNASVLDIDTTFNLSDLWLTNSCYKNIRIINHVTRNLPVFLGPLIFYLSKDQSTFSNFALEMMAFDSNISLLAKVGTNMDESIHNGVKTVIPEVKQLFCVRHLCQRDKKNLNGPFGKIKCSVSERNRAENRYLKHIYGDRKDSMKSSV